MQNKRQILVNAIMSVAQVVVISGILFVLYRFLLKTIGVENLGIWSVVLATTSVAGIANFGLSGSVVKFVAKYVARGEDEAVADVIQTALISISVAGGLVLLIAYPLVHLILELVMPSDSIEKALSILPYAIMSLWMIIIAGVLQSGLDGYQRIDIRSMILTASALFHLILSFVLVPDYGLMGLAYARVIQTVAMLVISWFMLKRFIPALPVFPYQWNRKLFLEMIGYGINFQAISITQMLCEPTTKALLTKFGGLSMVGFYEMASRMLLQLRSVLVSANQVLVPAIAHLQERSPDSIQNIYKDNYRLMLYIALPFYSIIIVATPVISEIWIGRYEPIFITFSILLAVALFVNTLSVPAYFSYLGVGKLKWNTLGHVITAIMNAILGFMVGYVFGGTGVVIGWIFSLIAGSLMIGISYHTIYKITLWDLLPRECLGVAISCLVAILTAFLIYYKFDYLGNLVLVGCAALLIFSAVIILPLWIHPMRKYLMGWVTYELLRKGLKKI
jgi:O-antigen/teichoic acid export membrane protein